MDVRLPNGTIIKNVPEGTTQTELMRRVNLIDTGVVNEEVSKTQKPGFLGRIAENVSQRASNIADIASEQAFKIPDFKDRLPGETTANIVGELAGGISDIAGESVLTGAKQIGKGIKEVVPGGIEKLGQFSSAITPDIIEEPIKKIGKKIGGVLKDLPQQLGELGDEIITSDVGKAGLQAIQKGANSYSQFKRDFPRAAQGLESSFNVVSLLAPVKGKPKIKSTSLGKIGKEARRVAEKITPQRAKALNADDVKALASKKYKEAAEKGGIFKAQATNKFLNQIENIKPKSKGGQAIRGSEDKSSGILKRLKEEIEGRDIGFDELQDIDQELGRSISQEFGITGLTPEGKDILDIQSKLRDVVENSKSSDLIEGSGFESLKEARSLWSRSAKLRDIEDIVNRAELMDQPATAIKSGFRVLLSNKKRLRGYSKIEREAIKEAAKTGIVGETLRTIGSRLTSIIASSTGGPAVGAAAFGASTAARGLGVQLQVNKAKKLFELVLKGEKVKDKVPLEQVVAKKINSLGGATLNNLGKTLQFIDNAIVKENNSNIVKNLRLDRAAILEVLESLTPIGSEDKENELG